MRLKDKERAEVIADQNDQFRKSFGRNPLLKGKVMQSQGVANLGPVAAAVICQKLMDFGDFDEQKNPYDQHDMGAFSISIDHAERVIWWKIDLYDVAYENASHAPENPKHTRRVMTVFFPEEH